jgi:hypothetical protein
MKGKSMVDLNAEAEIARLDSYVPSARALCRTHRKHDRTLVFYHIRLFQGYDYAG